MTFFLNFLNFLYRKRHFTIVLLGSFISIIFFQNCGKNFNSIKSEGSSIGADSPPSQPGFTQPSLKSNLMSAGKTHTCAIMTSGEVKCWGQNAQGQIGDGTTIDRPAPVTVLTGGVLSISSAEDYSCAIMAVGGVKCWGNNSSGQLGDGTTTNRLTPTNVVGITGRVSGLSLGAFHACAVLSSGSVKCWGNNSSGQLGDGTTSSQLAPTEVVGLTGDVLSISLGANHSCVVMTTGSVFCWGDNQSGQLADGTLTNRLTAVRVVGLTGAAQSISSGAAHTCVVILGSGVWCWGRNLRAQLNGSISQYSVTPVRSPVTSGAVIVAAGESHTCALTSTGAVQCWGDNILGQLGDGKSSSPGTSNVIGLSNGVVNISSGANHICAETSLNQLKCWGDNRFGQIGDGFTVRRNSPQSVTGLQAGVAQISTGMNHNCAVTTSGAVKCWGRNIAGALGQASADVIAAPTTVSSLGVAAARISSGFHYNCAVTISGGLQCWGNNASGQLGDGTIVSRAEPQDVTGLSSGVVSVAVANSHSCAVTTAGGLKCWGDNSSGQIGDGVTQFFSKTPVDVVGLSSGVASVAVGQSHSCAVTTAGGLKCWGDNAGKLGDGTATSRSTPVDVIGLSSGVASV